MKRTPPRQKFYVYEHWRPDTAQCFWVGKGNGNRAYSFERNRYYNSVVNKLSSLGMCVEVRMVESSLPEHEAFVLEKIRIAFWRSCGVKLTNATEGGEGVSGYRHTEKTRARIRKAFKGKPLPEEHRRKISVAQKGKPKPLTKEAAERKRRQMLGKRYALGNHFKHTEEAKRKIAEASRGRIFSEETRKKIGASKFGNTYNLGRPCNSETKAKISDAQKGKPRFTEEQKMHLSEIRKGKPWTEARRSAQSKRHVSA